VGLVRALVLLQVNEVIEGYDLIIRSMEYQNMLRRGEELNLINNIDLLNTYLRRNYINANNIIISMLKETCLMNAILMRMRGGEVMKGTRKKYQRNEDRIEQFKANYMEDHKIMLFLSNVRLCINN
jgi:hypothetical protein